MPAEDEKLPKFHIPPPPKEPSPEITGFWMMKDGRKMLEVEEPHCHPAVLCPDPNCKGHLKLHFIQGKGRGVVTAPCWGCKKTGILVNLTAISLELQLIDRSGTRFDPKGTGKTESTASCE